MEARNEPHAPPKRLARGAPNRAAGEAELTVAERRAWWRRERAGPLLRGQGRFASHASALRAALDPGASAPFGQVSRGLVGGLPSGARATTSGTLASRLP